MARKLSGVISVVLAILWPGAALAVYQETETTVTDQGKPIPEQTITVTIKQPTGTTQTSTAVRMRVVQKKRVKTDQSGRLKVTYDDKLVDRATAIVEFAWYVPGRGVVTREVALSSLGSAPVDLSQPGVVTTTASPRTPYVPARVYNWSGFYIGGQGSGTAWDQGITERIAGTHTVTNRLNNYNTVGGIGMVGGFDWAPGMSGLTIGPVASFNYVGQSNDRTFAGGFFIGTHINWNATLGGRLGWQVNDRILMYAVGGVEFSNYDFRSNFTGPVLAINRTATGWFGGGGVEYTQPDWRSANGQWTVFGQVTLSEFCGDLFRMPVFSPGFDYRIASDQVRATAGFTFRPNWGAPPPPP
jgi:outer membrane immunogenic protein